MQRAIPRIVVGYRPTVAVFKTFEPVPLATRSVSNDVCSHGKSTSTQAIPQAPLPAKIETSSKENQMGQCGIKTIGVSHLQMIENFDTLFINRPTMK